MENKKQEKMLGDNEHNGVLKRHVWLPLLSKVMEFYGI